MPTVSAGRSSGLVRRTVHLCVQVTIRRTHRRTNDGFEESDDGLANGQATADTSTDCPPGSLLIK